MAQFPVSKPFPPNASAADFLKRIKDVGWAPCTAGQLLGYAEAQFARIQSTAKIKSAIGLRRAKAQAVDEWFEAMGLPESLVTDDDFLEYSGGDRWIAGLGLNSSDDDYFGIIAVGAFDLRPDGSFDMTTVTRQALVERWDSRIGGPTAQRLLFNTDPLEVVVAVFTDDGSLLISGFHPRVFRLNARTLGDAYELTAIRNLETCPHGPEEPDDDDDEGDDDDDDTHDEVRVWNLRGTRHGTLAHNCCGEWVLLPNDGRGATRFMPFTDKVCFPPEECYTDTTWCITTDDGGRATVYRLPDAEVCARFTVLGGKIVNAVMPDHRTIVTMSESGHLQWWTIPATRAGASPATLSAHVHLPAGATFLDHLEAMAERPAYLLITTRYRRMMLLDPQTGAVLGETPRSTGVDLALRAGPNHVVVWDTLEPSGYQLAPLQSAWSEGISLSEADEGVGLLPDGRMVRAAFGVIVEDPRTGELLHDYRPE